MDHR